MLCGCLRLNAPFSSLSLLRDKPQTDAPQAVTARSCIVQRSNVTAAIAACRQEFVFYQQKSCFRAKLLQRYSVSMRNC